MLKNRIVKIVDIIRLTSKDSENLHGFHLDYPKKSYSCNAEESKLIGWALAKNNHSVVEIELLSHDRLIERISLDNPRQDVKEYFADQSFTQTQIGFSSTLNLVEILSKNESEELLLQAVLSNGNKIKLFKLKLSYEENFKSTNLKSTPDFIIIGAMKSATSAIYEYMMQHTQIARRLPKELHFFTLNYDKGLDWYLSQFTCTKKNELGQRLLIGEASPSYLSSAQAPSLISELLPNVKIIISLRNPTDRAISHYYHQFNRVKDETRPIETVFSVQEIANIKTNPSSKTSSYLQLGKYADQIKNWLDFFSRDQMLILNHQELEKDADKFMKRIVDFLNLEDYTFDITEKIYSNRYPIIPVDLKRRLDEFFEPYNAELENLLKTRFEYK